METNFLAVLGAAFIPMIMGFLWYGPMLFQKAWMKEMNFTQKGCRRREYAVDFWFELLV